MANTLESTSLPELQGFTRIGTDTVRHPRIEPGKLYSEAVRRCIRCDFDRRDMDLDSENFQEAVFDGGSTTGYHVAAVQWAVTVGERIVMGDCRGRFIAVAALKGTYDHSTLKTRLPVRSTLVE